MIDERFDAIVIGAGMAGNAAALGSGALTISGGSIDVAGGAAATGLVRGAASRCSMCIARHAAPHPARRLSTWDKISPLRQHLGHSSLQSFQPRCCAGCREEVTVTASVLGCMSWPRGGWHPPRPR